MYKEYSEYIAKHLDENTDWQNYLSDHLGDNNDYIDYISQSLLDPHQKLMINRIRKLNKIINKL